MFHASPTSFGSLASGSSMATLAEGILASVEAPEVQRLLVPFEPRTERQNQALLMLKPECFLGGGFFRERLELILGTVQDWGAELRGAAILDGSVLDRLGIIDAHYGGASRLSRSASRVLSPEDRIRALSVAGLPEGTPILGGHEYLAHQAGGTSLTPEALDEAWFQKGPRKIRSGFYGVPFETPDGPCLLVNGFYPAQARHFTTSGRRVVLLLLHSDLPWRVLRQEMLGDTYPEKAREGSIRRLLLEHKEALGLPRVDITCNGVHLSAGPFEGAFELQNFLGRLEGVSFTLGQSRLAQEWMAAGQNPARLEALLGGASWAPGRDLFGSTEDLDTRSAVRYVADLAG